MPEVKAFGRFLLLGSATGGALWVFGATASLAAGVAGVVVAFGSALALALTVADAVRRRALDLRPLAFWAACLCSVVLAVWWLASVIGPADADRLRASILASTLGGFVIGTSMDVCVPRAA